MRDENVIDVVNGSVVVAAKPQHIQLTHILYALHSVGLIMGAWSQAVTMIGAFVFGWSSIIAIIINYVKRDEMKGTFLESHFTWQTNTFWRCAIAMLICVALYFVLVGFFINWLLFGLVGLWASYRIIKGWLALAAGNPVA